MGKIQLLYGCWAGGQSWKYGAFTYLWKNSEFCPSCLTEQSWFVTIIRRSSPGTTHHPTTPPQHHNNILSPIKSHVSHWENDLFIVSFSCSVYRNYVRIVKTCAWSCVFPWCCCTVWCINGSNSVLTNRWWMGTADKLVIRTCPQPFWRLVVSSLRCPTISPDHHPHHPWSSSIQHT